MGGVESWRRSSEDILRSHFVASCGLWVACGSSPPPSGSATGPAPGTAEHAALIAAERSAFEEALSALRAHCRRCHLYGTPGHGSFDMDGYGRAPEEAGRSFAAATQRALGLGGHAASMPKDKPGSVTGDDRTRLLAWVEALHMRVGLPVPR